jgi:hypothetical protein
MKSKTLTARLAAALVLVAAAAPYAAALTLEATAEPYVFAVAGGGSFAILGRAPTPGGQRLILEQRYGPRGEDDVGFTNSPLNKSREQEVNELFGENHVTLADAAGGVYKAANARFVRYQDDPVGRIVELTFPGDAAGDVDVVVALAPGKTVRLPFGPAAKSYFRLATVTAGAGADVQVDTYAPYGAQDKWKAGETFHLVGPRGIGTYGKTADGERTEALYFLGVRDGLEGWVPYEVDESEEKMFIIGDFDAF